MIYRFPVFKLCFFFTLGLFISALTPSMGVAQTNAPQSEREKEAELPEATRRLLEKSGHKETVDWMKKEEKIRSQIKLLDSGEAQKHIERENNLSPRLSSEIGILDIRSGGFDSELWRQYNENNFKSDMELLIDMADYLPATRILALKALTTIAPPPRFFRNAEEFLSYRVHALLEMGFIKDAVMLYSNSVPPLSTLSELTHLIGTKTYLYNNNFDMACLENKLIERTTYFSETEKNLHILTRLLCASYMEGDINELLKQEAKAQAEKQSFAILDSILSGLEDKAHVVDAHSLVNKDYGSLVSFLLALSERRKISVNLEKLMREPLYKTVQIALLNNDFIGKKLRTDIFKEVAHSNLLDARSIQELFDNDSAFATRLGQGFFLNNDDEMPAADRFTRIRAQTLKNGNIGSTLSEIYLRNVARIRPVSALSEHAPFVIAYLYLNGEMDAAEKWFSYIPKEKKPFEIKKNDDSEEKNQSFFIFPLEEWHQIMLKEYVKFDEKSIFAQKSLASKLFQSSSNDIDSRKEFDSELQNTLKNLSETGQGLVRRLQRMSNKDGSVQIALIGSLLIEQERRNRSLSDDDFLILAKFVLHKIKESDLSDYALFLGRDIISDRLTYKR